MDNLIDDLEEFLDLQIEDLPPAAQAIWIKWGWEPQEYKNIELFIQQLGDPEFLISLTNNRRKTKKFVQAIQNNWKEYNRRTGKRLKIAIGNKWLTVSKDSLRKLHQQLKNKFVETTSTDTDSWQWVEAVVEENANISNLIRIESVSVTEAPDGDGGFFDKVNISPFDLTKFGILSYGTKLAEKLEKITEEHCIIATLKYFKKADGSQRFSENKLDVIRRKIKCNLRKGQLKEIATTLKVSIKLSQYKSDGNVQHLIYGLRDKPEIRIALYNHHYFPYVKMNYTSYILSNWKEYFGVEGLEVSEYVKKFKSKKRKVAHRIYKKEKGKYIKKDSKINSLAMVRRIDKSGGFISHKVFNNVPEMTQLAVRDINLNNIEDEYREMVDKKKNSYFNNQEVFYGDFETVTVTEDGEKIIKPFKLGLSDDYDSVTIYTALEYDSEYLVNEMLETIIDDVDVTTRTKIIIYFHNLKFDKTFFDHMHITGKCKKDGQYYSINCIYKGHTFEFRDSYKLISAPLSKFGAMFNIPCAKQEICYKLYTAETITLEKVKLSRAIEELEKQLKNSKQAQKKIEEFRVSANDFIKIEEGEPMFYHMDYMDFYLEMDCITLGKGLNVFAEGIKEVTELDAFEALTISSLTYKFCKNNEVFDNQYEVTGNLKDYMAKSIYGGRVCTRYGEKHHIKTGVGNVKGVIYTPSLISDFDGVSLYPSAIARLCEENLLPAGKPQVLTPEDLHNINSGKFEDYFIVDIKITSVGKKQQIPFIAYKNDMGGCVYTNEPPEDYIFTVDRITLEDWINFHQIEYEVQTLGVKYTETNNNFGNVINDLFEARLEYKKKMKDPKYSTAEVSGFNALQTIYKLMLNSSYGKTIIKSNNTKFIYLAKRDSTEEEFKARCKEYFTKHYNVIKNVTVFKNYAEVEQIESYQSAYNLTHMGTAILSMSKRIMNEVMDVLTDLDMPCYYQDTDSMHILKDNIEGMSEEYFNRYGKVLIGSKLGQFHNDFDLAGAKNVFSNELIVLGKKCYMDVLQGNSYVRDNSSNFPKLIYGEHCRMKGINGAGLAYQREEMGISTNKKIYEELYKGKELKFDLLYGGAFSVKYVNAHKATERNEFFRRLSF